MNVTRVAASWLSAGVVLAAGLSACASHSAQSDPGLPGAGTADVRVEPSGDIAHLAAVRLAGQDGYDRLVLEFTDRVPGYTVGYRPLPAHEDASGFEIPLPGAGALLEVSLNPATAAGWAGGPPTYPGPSTLTADTASVTEVKNAGDFEAVLTWVAGVRVQQPFRVEVLDSPPRLVIDVAH
jgi:hypothetical protein